VYARIASFAGGDTERLKQMNEQRVADGSMNLPEGVSRLMLLAKEDGDSRLFITFFETRAALEAAEARFESMGDEIPEDVRGRRTSVEVYEVVLEQ
jgi:hypothetical protein